MAVHAFSLRPTEGESTIRKDPRGDLTAAAGEEFGRSGLRCWSLRLWEREGFLSGSSL